MFHGTWKSCTKPTEIRDRRYLRGKRIGGKHGDCCFLWQTERSSSSGQQNASSKNSGSLTTGCSLLAGGHVTKHNLPLLARRKSFALRKRRVPRECPMSETIRAKFYKWSMDQLDEEQESRQVLKFFELWVVKICSPPQVFVGRSTKFIEANKYLISEIEGN